MRQQVLKALANPSYLFYVPYSLAVVNFAIQFIIFMVAFISYLLITGEAFTPLYFLLSVIFVHMILMYFSKRDPQFGQIITAKIQLLKRKIPKKLAA